MTTLLNIAKKIVLPCVAIVGAVYAIYYSVWAQNVISAESPMTSVSASSSSTDSGSVLAGPGIVEPAGQPIAVAPPMPGVVEFVISQERVNSVVKKGEELLRLDSKQLKAQLAVREAQLAFAKADLNRLKSPTRKEELAPLEAIWRKATTEVERTKGDYERAVEAGSGLTKQQLDEYRFAYAAARAQVKVDLAQWQLKKAGTWEQDVKVAEASVKLAESQVADTRLELDRLTVRCPSDLTLWKVDVRPQEYVGIPLGKTIIMLGSSRKELRVYIDEHDASRFLEALHGPGEPGKKGKARLPHRQEPFSLVYVSHEQVIVPKPILTGEQTERVDVRVLPVIYRFENAEDEKKAFVGQQLDVYINER